MKNDSHTDSVRSIIRLDPQRSILTNEELEDLSEITSQRIQAERKSTALTQEEFSEITGIAKSNVSKFETGITKPPAWRHLRVFATVFGCTTDYLLGLSDERNSDDPSPVGRERRLLQLFRQADEDGKAQGMAFMEQMALLNNEEAKIKAVMKDLELIREAAPGESGQQLVETIISTFARNFDIDPDKFKG